MSKRPRWVFLSPHLDDAILSCGALIAELAKAEQVEIWSIFTRAPLRGPYSHTADWLHGVSGGRSGARLASQRRQEDTKACAIVGATPVHLRFMEAAYRKRADGRFLYRDALQGSVHPDDAKLIDKVAAYLRGALRSDDVVVAPLAIAGHADHIVTREAARQCGFDLLYYAEVPYLETRTETLRESTQGMWHLNFTAGPGEVEDWLRAAQAYETQLAMFRDERGDIVDMIGRYASSDGFRLFTPDESHARNVAGTGAFSLHAPEQAMANPEPHALFSDQAAFPAWSDGPLAPIALFAFNRLDTLKETIASLERCDGFSDTTIHVFCDAASDDHPERDRAARVQAWLSEWCRKTGAELHLAEQNLGLRRSIVNGVSHMLTENDTVIVLEDDIVTSPAFLIFMNQALQAYRDRDEIMQVSGYFIPHSARLPPIGLLRAPGSWGWATWRRAWDHYSDDAKTLIEDVRSLDPEGFDINGSYGYFESLQKNADGSLDTWAVRWYASMFRRGGLAVYPALSFTRNIGFGDQGTNCKPGPMDRIYTNQRIRRRKISPHWQAIGTTESKSFERALESFYRWQNHQWTRPSMKERIRGSVTRLRTGDAPA
jgi:LmbE family N-acetylglucosaminyl deacetylase